jgi:hypothetical protein
MEKDTDIRKELAFDFTPFNIYQRSKYQRSKYQRSKYQRSKYQRSK